MNLSTVALQSEHLGIRELKIGLNKIKLSKWFISTSDNKPISVNVPFNEFLDLMELIDDLQDNHLLKDIQEGREAIKNIKQGFVSSYLK